MKKKWSQRFVNKNVTVDTVYEAILAIIDKGGFTIKEKKIEKKVIKGEFEAYKDYSPGKIYITGNDNDFSVFLEWEIKASMEYELRRHDPDNLLYLSKKGRKNSGKAWQRLTEIIPIIIEELHKGIINWFSSDYYLNKFLRYAYNKLDSEI
ncbi:MAG: hypothetical protein ACETWM_19620 [Candidatus Lokiarchaeia archaeon]